MRLYKDARTSWKAESEKEFNGRVLKLLTMRRSNGELVTTVQAVKNDGAFTVYRPFYDYNQTLHRERVRLTQAACTAQHLKWHERLDELAVDAERFYTLKGE